MITDMINFFKIMMYFLNIYVEDTTKINVYIIGFVYANLSIRNVLLIFMNFRTLTTRTE